MKIMQCWDDGVANDEPLTALLRKYKAKATFNLNPALSDKGARRLGTWKYKNLFLVDKLSLDEMKELYKGFKVAGHTMTHPHPTKISPEQLKSEMVDCKAFIKDFLGQGKCGFAYPFGDYDETVKKAVRDAGFLYARTTKNVDGKLPLEDPMELHSHCHFMSPDFWRKYDEVRAQDGVFYFWGHSYEMMDDKALWDEFEAKLAKISADPKAEWIDIIDLFA
jgi:peptidoglycan/xylan/chitin deacetylase (PgdA/CDA1 family)